MPKNPIKISASITDFAPLFSNLEYLFKGLSTTGIDGIELVTGIKSRWSAKKIVALSEKYQLPIRSIHQPIWSGLDWYFDEGLADFAKALGTKTIVFHPLPSLSYSSKKMQQYLQKIANLQEKKGIEVCLENMSKKHAMKFLDYLFPLDSTTADITELFAIAKKYGFKITLDTDHLHNIAPHKEPWFNDNFDLIGNIHLSSFHKNQEHMPLYLGDFQGKEFYQMLVQKKYLGLLTMEIYYPSLLSVMPYDFDAIKKSVDFLREK